MLPPQTIDAQPHPTRVYVAGPYSHGDQAANVRNAIAAADRLWAAGLVPFVPHLTHFWDLLTPRPHAEWLAYDRHWVAACDCLLRLPGESAGADAEVELARSLGKAVYGSVGECVAGSALAHKSAGDYPHYYDATNRATGTGSGHWKCPDAGTVLHRYPDLDYAWTSTGFADEATLLRERSFARRCSATDAGDPEPQPARPVDPPPDLQSQVATLTAQLADAEERERVTARELERIHRGNAPEPIPDIGDPLTLAQLAALGVGDLVAEHEHRIGPVPESMGEAVPDDGRKAMLVDALRRFATDYVEPAAVTPDPNHDRVDARYVGRWNSRVAVGVIAAGKCNSHARWYWTIDSSGELLQHANGKATLDGRGFDVAKRAIDNGAWVRCSTRGGPVEEDDAPATCAPGQPSTGGGSTASTPGSETPAECDRTPAVAPPPADDIGRRLAERAVTVFGVGVRMAGGFQEYIQPVADPARVRGVLNCWRSVVAAIVNAAVAEATAPHAAEVAGFRAEVAGVDKRVADAVAAERATLRKGPPLTINQVALLDRLAGKPGPVLINDLAASDWAGLAEFDAAYEARPPAVEKLIEADWREVEITPDGRRRLAEWRSEQDASKGVAHGR